MNGNLLKISGKYLESVDIYSKYITSYYTVKFYIIVNCVDALKEHLSSVIYLRNTIFIALKEKYMKTLFLIYNLLPNPGKRHIIA